MTLSSLINKLQQDLHSTVVLLKVENEREKLLAEYNIYILL